MQSEQMSFQSAFERGQRLGCSDIYRKVIPPSWGQNWEQSWTVCLFRLSVPLRFALFHFQFGCSILLCENPLGFWESQGCIKGSQQHPSRSPWAEALKRCNLASRKAVLWWNWHVVRGWGGSVDVFTAPLSTDTERLLFQGFADSSSCIREGLLECGPSSLSGKRGDLIQPGRKGALPQ